MQNAFVALIVATCFAYAAWMLMPSVWRRSLAQRALPLPWPQAIARHLQRAATSGNGCACDGCDSKTASKTPSAVQPIRIHRKPR